MDGMNDDENTRKLKQAIDIYLRYISKLQRPIVPKCVGVSSSQIRITIISDFCLSDGANPMILVDSNMELQLLKHTSLRVAISTVIFGLPAAKVSGIQTLQMCL